MNRASMKGLRIENGDLILIRQQAIADPGEIVVAIIDGEATTKRLATGPNYYLLKPESTNPAHRPIMVNRDFRIAGVVCHVFKGAMELMEL